MKILLCLAFWLLLLSDVQAQGQPTAQISKAFSQPEDIQKPDFTISGEGTKLIAAVAYNLNGRFLAVAGSNNAIRVYDARSGDLSHTLKGHTSSILAIGFSDTNTLVSLSADQTVKTWDIVSGKLLHNTEIKFEKQLIPAIAPGGQSFVVGGSLNQVRLWNYQTGKLLQTFEVNDSNVAALAFTPDGKLLVIGSTKGVLRVMDVATWKVTRTIDLDTPIYSIAASMNRILVGYGDGTLVLLTIGDQDSIPEVKKHSGAITAVAFSPKGDQFASASVDKTVRIWDTSTMKLLRTQAGHSGEVLSVVFSPDGQKLASGGADGTVNVWTVPLPPSHQ